MAKKLTIVGDNYISRRLYQDFKRYGKYTPDIVTNTTNIKERSNYIIDSTFNIKQQQLSINYARNNSIDKLIILNHWKIDDLPDENISQMVVYDVLSDEHYTFDRCGYGNQDDGKIQYCNFISETIRRIHEHKVGGLPLLYLTYGEKEIPYSNINNLYKPLLKLLTQKESLISYYDNKKRTEEVISIIKEVIDYEGDIIFKNNHEFYTHRYKRIDANTYDYLHKTTTKIYQSLRRNNIRFDI